MLACTFLHFVAYVARLRGKASFSLSPCTLGISVLKALFGSPRPFRCLLEIKNGRGWSEWSKPLMYISNAPQAHVHVLMISSLQLTESIQSLQTY